MPDKQRRNKDEFITRTTVSRRPGWTLGLVEKVLGAPDEHRKVRGFANELCLYRITRVEAAEQSGDFVKDKEARLKRKASAARAVETKIKALLEQVAVMRVRVAVMGMDQVRDGAIRSYNNRHIERSMEWRGDDDDYTPARKDSDRTFLNRIMVNFLRHERTSYDLAIEAMIGKTGNQQAIGKLRERIYGAISAAYPELAVECARQLEERKNA